MKNIHVLPTEKASNGYVLGKCIKELSDVKIGQFTKTYYLMFDEKYFQPHNIYITSDEKIKEGDWFLPQGHINPHKLKGYNKINGDLESYNGLCYDISKCKKIILTTDQDLIKDGVQAIDNEFLEWFVKNPSCEWVEVEIESKFDRVDGHYHDVWEIIIPKEEAKQETLEEAAERWVFETNGHKWSNNDDSAGDNFGSFVAGSRWRSDNSYTLDELKEAYSMGRLGKSISEFNERFKN